MEEKEESTTKLYHIERIDGASPVQATGIIGTEYRFYFRGRFQRRQFVVGPSNLQTENLAEQYNKARLTQA